MKNELINKLQKVADTIEMALDILKYDDFDDGKNSIKFYDDDDEIMCCMIFDKKYFDIEYSNDGCNYYIFNYKNIEKDFNKKIVNFINLLTEYELEYQEGDYNYCNSIKMIQFMKPEQENDMIDSILDKPDRNGNKDCIIVSCVLLPTNFVDFLYNI